MSQTIRKDKKILIFSFVAAATTVIAGILHLQMVPGSLSHDMGEGILFLVGGVLQVFWAIPVIKQWGRIWQIIGIVGTIIFVILFYLSRFHLLPEGNILGGVSHENIPRGEFPRSNMTGGEIPRGPRPEGTNLGFGRMLPPIEIFQIAFIGLYMVLSRIMISKRQIDKK
jgi:hypothetical protein